MKNSTCPCCKKDTISTKDKYFAGIWRVIHCCDCNSRLCANPILMAVAYAVYFWAFAWFGYLAFYHKDPSQLLYLIPIWFFLDFLNIKLMPLSIMKKKRD